MGLNVYDIESRQLRGNADLTFRDQFGTQVSGGYDLADTLHNIYFDYGYPFFLSFFNYWNMYRRLGVAKNIVELPTDTGWRTPPIIDGGSAFDTAFEELEQKLSLFIRLGALDRYQRVGRYAGLFIRVRDNQEPSQPVATSLGGVNAIIEVKPVYEGQLTVASTDNDPMSDTFGMPAMYNFNSGATGNRDEKFNTSFNVHPDRLVIAAEGADDGGILGISSLEAPYNSLMDLRKIIGGGGEGYYRNAAKDIFLGTKPDVSNVVSAAMLETIEEQVDDFIRDRMRKIMVTPGLEAKALDANLANPREFFFNALYDCAAASKIPATILIGQQTGRLASDEDSRHFLSSVKARRENFQTDLVEKTINWFIEHGVLPSSEYEVSWDDLLAPSDQEMLDNTKRMAEINQVQVLTGRDEVFSSEELREAAGFDPDEMPEPEGEDEPEEDEPENDNDEETVAA